MFALVILISSRNPGAYSAILAGDEHWGGKLWLDLSDHALTTITTWGEISMLGLMVYQQFAPRLRRIPIIGSSTAPVRRRGRVSTVLWENRTIIVALIGLAIVIWMHWGREMATEGLQSPTQIASPAPRPTLSDYDRGRREKEIDSLLSELATGKTHDAFLAGAAISDVLSATLATPDKDRLADLIDKYGNLLEESSKERKKITDDYSAYEDLRQDSGYDGEKNLDPSMKAVSFYLRHISSTLSAPPLWHDVWQILAQSKLCGLTLQSHLDSFDQWYGKFNKTLLEKRKDL